MTLRHQPTLSEATARTVGLLGDEDWQARRRAAGAISTAVASGELKEAELDALLQDLTAMLADASVAGRRAAAIAVLEAVATHDATRARVLRHIAARINDAPANARIGLTGVVGAAGGTEAVALLAPLTRDADTNTATAAIAALGRTRSVEATPVLLGYLSDPNDWLRFAAVGALGELGDARAAQHLEPLLEDPLLHEAAADALSEIATADAARALAHHLHDPSGALRPSALKSLVSLAADARSLPRAVSEWLATEARRLFLETTGEHAFDQLLALPATPDPARASARIIALGWSGDPRAVPHIARALDDPATAKAAQTALAALSRNLLALRQMLSADPATIPHSTPDDDDTNPHSTPDASATAIPRTTLAAALAQADTPATVEAAARLAVEATDPETLEAALAALAHARERFLHQSTPHHPATPRHDATRQLATTGAAQRAPANIERHTNDDSVEFETNDDSVEFEKNKALVEAETRNDLVERPRANVESERQNLIDGLRALLQTASGAALVKIAETLGALVSMASPVSVETVARDLPAGDEEDATLARLAFFANLAAPPDIAGDTRRRARRHRSAEVRIRAVEAGRTDAAAGETESLIACLTDEATGVRRAATRALRRTQSDADARRALLAALVDEDIWVQAETVVTLGALYGNDAGVRGRLRESLAAPHPLCRVAATEALAALDATPEDWQQIAHLARRDALPEVRRAAVLAFTRCPAPRTALAIARAALRDARWPVRRAAVDILAACDERSAHKLLLDAATAEEPPVRGAAVRALAAHGAPETVALACRAIAEPDPTLLEDAYAALLALRLTRRAELLEATRTCAPRAAAIVAFILVNRAS